jgi:hypothetical protein
MTIKQLKGQRAIAITELRQLRMCLRDYFKERDIQANLVTEKKTVEEFSVSEVLRVSDFVIRSQECSTGQQPTDDLELNLPASEGPSR